MKRKAINKVASNIFFLIGNVLFFTGVYIPKIKENYIDDLVILVLWIFMNITISISYAFEYSIPKTEVEE